MIKKVLLAAILLAFFARQSEAQTLAIHSFGGNLNERDSLLLNKLVLFEAHIFNSILDKPLPDTLVVNVNLYHKHKLFNAVSKENIFDRITVDGFYSPLTRQCYVDKTNRFHSVLIHESSHLFLHTLNNFRIPRWFNEGLATFFEGLDISEQGSPQIARDMDRLQDARNYINKEDFDLRGFFSPETAPYWHKRDNVQQMYSVAYSIVYFMVTRYPEKMKQFIANMQKGQTPERAIGSSFSNFTLFEQLYRSYYR